MQASNIAAVCKVKVEDKLQACTEISGQTLVINMAFKLSQWNLVTYIVSHSLRWAAAIDPDAHKCKLR